MVKKQLNAGYTFDTPNQDFFKLYNNPICLFIKKNCVWDGAVDFTMPLKVLYYCYGFWSVIGFWHTNSYGPILNLQNLTKSGSKIFCCFSAVKSR